MQHDGGENEQKDDAIEVLDASVFIYRCTSLLPFLPLDAGPHLSMTSTSIVILEYFERVRFGYGERYARSVGS